MRVMSLRSCYIVIVPTRAVSAYKARRSAPRPRAAPPAPRAAAFMPRAPPSFALLALKMLKVGQLQPSAADLYEDEGKNTLCVGLTRREGASGDAP